MVDGWTARNRVPRNAGERIIHASSIYPHERGHGISTPRFQFYRQTRGYSSCGNERVRSRLTHIKSSRPRIVRVRLVMPTRWPRSTSSCWALPFGDGGKCDRDDVAARRLKQIFYEGSRVTAIIIKRWSWHAVPGCKVGRQILPSFRRR